MPELEADKNASDANLVEGLSTWDEVRRIAEEIGLRIHLAGMEAKDRWREVEPRLEKMEQQIARAGERVGHALAAEMAMVRTMLYQLRDEVKHER